MILYENDKDSLPLAASYLNSASVSVDTQTIPLPSWGRLFSKYSDTSADADKGS